MIAPMLLMPVREPFDSPEYAYEVKWDGMRLLAFTEEPVRLQTRRLRSVQTQFPEVVEACAGLPEGTVLDGELVVFRNERPDFESLRQRIATHAPRKVARLASDLPATFLGFDLLYLAGESLMGLPLKERRKLLLQLRPYGGLTFPDHFDSGTALFEAVQEQGLEGIVAKRRDSQYMPGRRCRSWMKCKQPGYDLERFVHQRRRRCHVRPL